MDKIIINEYNYTNFFLILEQIKKRHIVGLDLKFIPGSGLDKEKIREIIDLLRHHEKYFQFRINGLPFCLISETEDRLVINEASKQKIHLKICRRCRYNKRCAGVLKKELNYYRDCIKPVADLPREIMIELESRCNFNCVFCFNKNSFAIHGREKVQTLSTGKVKKIIDAVAKSGVKIIRFTGGEPMLRHDLWELMDCAKNKGLKVRLNTNGSLINSRQIVERLNNYVSSILLPIESYNNRKESMLTGHKDSLKKKIKNIKLLKKYGKMTVRAGTVATRENIKDLEKIFNLVINKLGLDDWEVYRPIPILENKFPIDRRDFKILVDKLLKFKKQTGRIFNIVNAVPFCAYDKKKVDEVSNGALSVDGHIRYAIDPRGFAKSDYYIDNNIGNPLDIKTCWNHPFMKKMRNLGFVPKECSKCKFIEKCRGGSRFAAKMAFGSFSAKDPLMP